MTLGETIRHYRRLKKWSQGQLAIYTGLDQSFISRLEKDSFKSASPANLQKIAEALDAPLNDLWAAAGVHLTEGEAPPNPIDIPAPFLALVQRWGPVLTDRDWEAVGAFLEGRMAERAERAPAALAPLVPAGLVLDQLFARRLTPALRDELVAALTGQRVYFRIAPPSE